MEARRSFFQVGTTIWDLKKLKLKSLFSSSVNPLNLRNLALGPEFSVNWESENCEYESRKSQLLIRELIRYSSPIHCIIIRKYSELRGTFFFKSSRIRDFQEINMKLQISEDSELEGPESRGFTVYT